jgi:hypothetical protein
MLWLDWAFGQPLQRLSFVFVGRAVGNICTTVQSPESLSECRCILRYYGMPLGILVICNLRKAGGDSGHGGISGLPIGIGVFVQHPVCR